MEILNTELHGIIRIVSSEFGRGLPWWGAISCYKLQENGFIKSASQLVLLLFYTCV